MRSWVMKKEKRDKIPSLPFRRLQSSREDKRMPKQFPECDASPGTRWHAHPVRAAHRLEQAEDRY